MEDLCFFEDDVSILSDSIAMDGCTLLILNLMVESELPAEAEQHVKAYLERGGDVLLLHCGSAAFVQWAWWSPLVGLRWVRPGNSEGLEPSTHPVRPYRVATVNSGHPLSRELRDLDLPEDEIYIHLHQTSPVTVLMETETDEGVFPQCFEALTPWGGKMISFLPGHRSEIVTHSDFIFDVMRIINYTLIKGENYD